MLSASLKGNIEIKKYRKKKNRINKLYFTLNILFNEFLKKKKINIISKKNR